MENEIKFSPLEYKSENFEVLYLEIEKILTKTNDKWLTFKTIKITYDEKLLNIISFFDIEASKKGEKYIEIKIINLIFLSIITNLLNLWISKTKTKSYLEKLINNQNFIDYPLIIDFYILQSLLNREINIYIYQWEVNILSQEEFNIMKRKFKLSDNVISINFNKILYKISKNDWYLNIKNNNFILENSSIKILKKLYNKEYKNMNLRKDKNWEFFLLKSELNFKGNDTLHWDLVKKFKYSEITTKVEKNKIKSFKVSEFIKFD